MKGRSPRLSPSDGVSGSGPLVLRPEVKATAKVTLACETCRGEFSLYPSQVRKGAGRFCSKRCRASAPRKEAVRGTRAGLLAALAMGYRVSQEGVTLDPAGAPVKVNLHAKTRYWTFSARGCRSPLSVHQLAALQRYGEVALDSDCVRHLDGDRNNNRPENIGHGTFLENVMDMPVEQRRRMGRARNRRKRRFTDDQVRAIRRGFVEGRSLTGLQREYGCGFGSLTKIRDRVTYYDVHDDPPSAPQGTDPPGR